jgi:hypothetical protein
MHPRAFLPAATRESLGLEEAELQDDAYPYDDWNEKTTADCYRRNAAPHVFGPDKRIITSISNTKPMKPV